MRVLVTGCAGFIGHAVTKLLIKKKHFVIGVDNLNSYYSKKLKINRINDIKKISKNKFFFFKIDIQNLKKIQNLSKKYKIKYVVHLAAQAGVRYSISNPEVYTKSNLLGFFNIIELCKNLKIKHLVFASSSSVYGSGKLPFSEKHRTDSPLQYYAATKKSNEIMSFSYSSLYKIPTTCLRYFTVYGPWGRPDMAIYKFYNLIKNDKTIYIYNKGKHKRDFTFIEDAALMTYKALIKIPKKNPPFQILNISNGNSEKITDIIKFIQKEINKKAKVKFLDLQLGDIKNTRSSISKTRKYLNYFSKTKLSEGIKKFILWHESR